MNLDKLKKLKFKATPKEWMDDGSGDVYAWGKKYQEYHVKCKFSRDATYIVALHNQAEEMIETIERYKTALEKCFTESTINEPGLYEQALSRICGISREALKDTKEETNDTRSTA